MREMMGLLRRDIAAHRMAYAVCLLLGMVGELMVLVQPKFGGDLIAAVQSGDSFGARARLTSNEMALSDSKR